MAFGTGHSLVPKLTSVFIMSKMIGSLPYGGLPPVHLASSSRSGISSMEALRFDGASSSSASRKRSFSRTESPPAAWENQEIEGRTISTWEEPVRSASASANCAVSEVIANKYTYRTIITPVRPSHSHFNCPCQCGDIKPHDVDECRLFRTLPVEGRWNLVMKRHICILCLKTGHSHLACREMYPANLFRCLQCSGPHHFLLHPMC